MATQGRRDYSKQPGRLSDGGRYRKRVGYVTNRPDCSSGQPISPTYTAPTAPIGTHYSVTRVTPWVSGKRATTT
jgi:hypothetical protein